MFLGRKRIAEDRESRRIFVSELKTRKAVVLVSEKCTTRFRQKIMEGKSSSTSKLNKIAWISCRYLYATTKDTVL